jgi:hypothetical protein
VAIGSVPHVPEFDSRDPAFLAIAALYLSKISPIILKIVREIRKREEF